MHSSGDSNVDTLEDIEAFLSTLDADQLVALPPAVNTAAPSTNGRVNGANNITTPPTAPSTLTGQNTASKTAGANGSNGSNVSSAPGGTITANSSMAGNMHARPMMGGPFSGMHGYGRMPPYMYNNMMQPGMHPAHAMPMGMPHNMTSMNMAAMNMGALNHMTMGGMGVPMGMMQPGIYSAPANMNANSPSSQASSGNSLPSSGTNFTVSIPAPSVRPPRPVQSVSTTGTSSIPTSATTATTSMTIPPVVVGDPQQITIVQGENMHIYHQLVKQMSPEAKVRMTDLWNQLHNKTIKQDEFMVRAQDLLGPENYRLITESNSSMTSVPPSSAMGSAAAIVASPHVMSSVSFAPTTASVPLKRTSSMPGPGAVAMGGAAKRLRPPLQSGHMAASSPATNHLSNTSRSPLRNMGSGTGQMSQQQQQQRMFTASPLPSIQTTVNSTNNSSSAHSNATMSPTTSMSTSNTATPNFKLMLNAAQQHSLYQTPQPQRQYQHYQMQQRSQSGLNSSSNLSANRPPSRGTIGDSARARLTMLASTATPRAADGEDAFSMANISMQEEEALLQSNRLFLDRHAQGIDANSGGDNSTVEIPKATLVKEQFFCSLEGVKAKVDSVCQLENLTASNASYYYLTLALQERLTTMLSEMSKASSHRSNRSLRNQFNLQMSQLDKSDAGTGDGLIKGRGDIGNNGSNGSDTGKRRQQQQQPSSHTSQQQPTFYQLTLTSNIASQLALIEHHDKELDRAFITNRDNTATIHDAGGLPTTTNSSVFTTGATGDSAMDGTDVQKPRKERPKLDSRNLSEDAKTQRANAIAMKAAGGKVKSWMLMSSSASPLALMGGIGGDMGPPAMKRNGSGGGGNNAIGSASGVSVTVTGRKSRRGQRVPGTGGVPVKRIGIREAALVLESDIGTGQGMWNETGVGKVTGRMWIRMTERAT